MLAEAARAASATVVAALQRASVATGSDFHYLLGTALRESGLKPQAQSSTSSAAGLFQFVEQTWYGLVKEYGAKHGLSSYANAISKGPDGRYRANDPADRQAILGLRNDPQISAMMAGEYAHQTQTEMQASLGRPVCGGELYAAHFLGADSACRLIQANGSAPNTAAANLFPQAANANKSVFYNSNGTPKTVRDVYNWAMNQPSPSVSHVEVASATPAATPVVSTTENYPDVLALLWSQPVGRGFFSGGSGESAPSPFLLSPGVLDILTGVAKDRDAS